jgi:hypothetical protein
MDIIALVAFVLSIYLAGLIAKRRGRSVRNWGWVAAFIGPFALLLLFLFPNLHRKNDGQAQGLQREMR